MKKRKFKKKELFKFVKLHWDNGVCSIILNMDSMFAEYMPRKEIKCKTIKVSLYEAK